MGFACGGTKLASQSNWPPLQNAHEHCPRRLGCGCARLKAMPVKPLKLPCRNFAYHFRGAALGLAFVLPAVPSGWAQRPLGTDVSGYQPSVNWTTVKNAGVTFAWTKATEGTYYVNPYFTAQESGAKSVGIYIGAYHYARPSVDTNLTGPWSAESEAAYFWSVASNYVKGAGTYLVPMLDWEDIYATNGYGGFNGFTTSFLSAWVNQWCNTVSNSARASGVTLKPIVYTGTWYSVPGSVYPGLNSTVTSWPAWIAAYNGQRAQTGGPASSSPWSTWTVWQYADTNWSGGDADVFNGTASGLGSLVIGGLNGPSLASQPILNPAVDAGGSVSLSATANGLAPLKYQWTLNGANIANATNATLTVANVQTNHVGFYALVVTNAYGSVTSSPVSLLVYPVQTPIFADNFDTNSAANWVVNKSSSDTAVAFNFDYSAFGIPSAPHSTGGTTRGVQLKANLTAGVCSALSISPANQNFSGDYRLHFDAWLNVNGPFPAGGASSTEFLTAGIGTAGNRAEWTTNANADGYYFSADGDGGVSATSTTFGDYSGYIGKNWQPAASGIYAAGSLDNGAVYYATAFPTGRSAPALQQADYAQQTGALSGGTFGLAWHDVIVSRRGGTVDWVVDGIRLATISNATFTASNVFVGFWDPFASLTDNTNLSFVLVDNLRVEVPALMPVFTLGPLPQTVKLGANVSFTAAAAGLPAPNFQWLFNGVPMAGATNASYALAMVAATNVGNYSVTAANVAGAITSSAAALALLPPAAAQFRYIRSHGGVVQLLFTGDPVWIYTLEVSTNLADWSALAGYTSTNGVFDVTVTPVTDSPMQFYRARAGP